MIVVNRGQVLLVERAPAVAAGCARALRGAGWTVTLAWDLATGLAALGEPGAGYDCVVVDVALPGNQAFDFVRAVHVRCPGLPVLLVVGPAGGLPPPELGAAPPLRHPLDPQALVGAVARAARR